MLRLFPLLFLCILSSCGRTNLSGTDTGNPEVTATLTDSAGVPLVSARVLVYEQSTFGLATGIVDTFSTDSLGQIRLSLDSLSSVGLIAEWRDSLAIYQRVVAEKDTEVSLVAGPYVAFPVADRLDDGDSVIALLEGTGQILQGGSLTELPPGLWTIQYRAGLQDSLYPLDVRIQDARNLESILEGLAFAAYRFDSLGVEPKEYVRLIKLPEMERTFSTLKSICESAGFSSFNQCEGTDSCRIWQWSSDWFFEESDSLSMVPVDVAVVTGFGNVQCVAFTDTVIDSVEGQGASSFYALDEVQLK